MFKAAKVLMPMLVLSLLVVGCSTDQNPMQSNDSAQRLAQYAIPPGATLESATFYIYLYETPSDQRVQGHRITDMWDEYTVTWASFGGAYDMAVEGSFFADAPEWHTMDITSLVGDWLDGTYPNYGLLLNQDSLEYPRTYFRSRETIWGPWMEVCYSMGGATVCDTVMASADTYIWEAIPDGNHGTENALYTGRPSEGAGTKQTLVWFDLDVQEPELAAIGDFVWHDMNQDGIQDEGEPGIEGIVVHLLDCDGNILAETTTDANGYYLFDELMPGDYNIHFVIPEPWILSPQDQGADDAMDSDADMNGFTICTTLEGGETDLTWDAGVYMPPQEGCTRTIGYWKTHAGFGPQDDMVSQYLPIWLGEPGGDKSIAVTDNEIAYEILSMAWTGSNSNGIIKLYAQLLGAKLNLAAGASGTDLGDYVATADAFLSDYDWMDWDMMSGEDQEVVNMWQELFDEYNNGDIGPGHCDDFIDYDDDDDDD